MNGRRRATRVGVIAAAAAMLLSTGGLATVATGAMAAGGVTEVTDASFLWGMSQQYQGGNPGNSTCNYFSAGTQSEYAAEVGNVRIVHDTAGDLALSSAATKCTGSTGNAYRQLMLLSNGTGTADPATGEAEIAWDGALVANAYGGLVPWSVSDLALHVDGEGSGTLTATLGGYGSSMENPDEMIPLEPIPVTLATFDGVTVTDTGIEVLPDYAGVEIEVPEDVGTPQNRDVQGWGSWPQSVVDFHIKSGLSSYWYSSGGAADHTKAASAFTVQFSGAPEVREAAAPPTISTQTKIHSNAAVIVNGRSVDVTAAAQGATEISWERSVTNRKLGAYEEIAGAHAEKLTFTATDEWNSKYVRMVAKNASGTVRSEAVLVLTTDYIEAAFSEQPKPVTGFAGHPLRITLAAKAFPQLVQDRNRIEMSTDDGKTWAAVPGSEGASNGLSAFVIPSLEMKHDGMLIRAVSGSIEGREAGSPGQTAFSEPTRVTVLPAVGDGPQLAAIMHESLDPAVDTTVTLVGAGFTVPKWDEADPNIVSYLDLSLYAADEWTPGSGGLTAVPGVTFSPNASATGTGLSEANMTRQMGTFVLTATVPAGTLDANTKYGFGAYLRANDVVSGTNTWSKRSGDAWTPITLVGQEPEEFTPAEVDLTAENRRAVTVPKSARAGDEIEVAISEAHADETVQVFLFSEPVSLGTPTVSATGSFRATVPANAAPGAHKLAVYTAAGVLVGWEELTVTAPATEGGSDSGSNGGSDAGANGGSDAQGTGAQEAGANGAGTGANGANSANGANAANPATAAGLAHTGSVSMGGILGAAGLVLLFGAGVVLLARRTAQRNAE